MMPKMILGLAGRKRSGKSAVTNLLVKEYGAKRSSFADPLKRMLLTFGLTDEQLFGSEKEIPDFELLHGKTPRHAMQTLGTEWGRELISPDIWAEAWKRLPDVEQPTLLVVEDVRFDNEIAAIRQCGGLVLGIERGKPTLWHSVKERLRWVHQSENFHQLVKRNNLQTIPNDDTLEVLMDRVMFEAHAFAEQKREEALTTAL